MHKLYMEKWSEGRYRVSWSTSGSDHYGIIPANSRDEAIAKFSSPPWIHNLNGEPFEFVRGPSPLSKAHGDRPAKKGPIYCEPCGRWLTNAGAMKTHTHGELHQLNAFEASLVARWYRVPLSFWHWMGKNGFGERKFPMASVVKRSFNASLAYVWVDRQQLLEFLDWMVEATDEPTEIIVNAYDRVDRLTSYYLGEWT